MKLKRIFVDVQYTVREWIWWKYLVKLISAINWYALELISKDGHFVKLKRQFKKKKKNSLNNDSHAPCKVLSLSLFL